MKRAKKGKRREREVEVGSGGRCERRACLSSVAYLVHLGDVE